jgi:queuine tRNA-ribosyltransferase
MFDCVMPTRNARNGTVFTSRGRMAIKASRYGRAFDQPLDPDCSCPVCKRYSRAYIRHLFNVDEILGLQLATFHSLYFYLNLMGQMRQAIEQGVFAGWKVGFLEKYLGGETPGPESAPTARFSG